LWDLLGEYTEPDFVFSTYFFGVGASIIALSNIKVFKVARLSGLGRKVLGIYAIHMIYVDFFLFIDDRTNSIIWQFTYIILVLFLSIYTTNILSRIQIFKRVI
jgi:surface polysaccharide O-acyltransferase-like enzyme